MTSPDTIFTVKFDSTGAEVPHLTFTQAKAILVTADAEGVGACAYGNNGGYYIAMAGDMRMVFHSDIKMVSVVSADDAMAHEEGGGYLNTVWA